MSVATSITRGKEKKLNDRRLGISCLAGKLHRLLVDELRDGWVCHGSYNWGRGNHGSNSTSHKLRKQRSVDDGQNVFQHFSGGAFDELELA